MNKIEEMLKNEKVEWRKLGELIDYEQPTKYIVNETDYSNEYEIPVLTAGQTFILGYTNEKENTYKASNEFPVIIFDDFTTSNHWVDFEFKIKSSAMKILKPKNSLITFRYCYYFIKTLNIDITDHKRMWISKISNIEIPIPSIKTQEKIVKILDKFTKYATELETELEKRIKQYNHYRDRLLSETYLEKITREMEEDRTLLLTTLGEIGEFTRGNGLQKKDFLDNGNPVIHYGQIYTKYGFYAEKVISYVSDKIFSKLKKAKKNDILIATTSENMEDVGKCVVWLGEEEIGFSGDMYSYRTNQNAKYIAYYFQTNEFQKIKERKVTGTKLSRIHGEDMSKIPIYLPSLDIQNKVVKILDKFQEMLEDTKGLLPQEIELRRKQYEYYREKLLTFDSEYARERELGNGYLELLAEATKIVGLNLWKIKRKKLDNVIKSLKTGLNPRSFFKLNTPDAENYYVTIREIEKNKIKFSDKTDRINNEALKLCNNRSNLEVGDVIFSGTGTIGEVALIEENPYNWNIKEGVYSLKPNCEIINSKYLMYALMGKDIKNKISKKIFGGTVKSISMKDLIEIKILLPSLEVQEYVVSILDKFDTLVNDIKIGLPKEIELRQKQYEYYREKLLNFKK